MRPTFVKIGFTSERCNTYSPKPFSKTNLKLNVGNGSTLVMDMPLKTIKEFIEPFAMALKRMAGNTINPFHSCSEKVALNDVATSTFSKTCHYRDENANISNNLEQNIMKRLHSSLMEELNLEFKQSFPIKDKIQSNFETEPQSLDNDKCSSPIDVKINSHFNPKPFDGIARNDTIDCTMNKSENSSHDALEKSCNNIIQNGFEHPNELHNQTSDWCEPTGQTETFEPNSYKIVQEMATVITDYYFKLQDFQADSTSYSECIKQLYIELALPLNKSIETLTKKQIQDLRLSVHNELPKIFHGLNDKLMNIFQNDVEKRNHDNHMEKILHDFFENLELSHMEKTICEENNIDLDISDLTSIENNNTSTPEKSSTSKLSDEEEIISFQTGTSRSSASSYWITLNKSPNRNAQCNTSLVFNVDDIPLKHPSEYVDPYAKFSENLESFPEHTRQVIFCDTKASSGYKDSNENFIAENAKETLEKRSSNIKNNEQLFDHMAAGDHTQVHDYISIHEPEVNVVVCNSVSFFRTNTINATSYIRKSNIEFSKTEQAKRESNSLTDEDSFKTAVWEDCKIQNSLSSYDSDEEGNWMGFQGAKF